jgi:protein-tyrosine phosphatase
VSVHRDNIVAFLDSIDGEYGSVKGFLKHGLDFSDSDLENMQKLFLDD